MCVHDNSDPPFLSPNPNLISYHISTHAEIEAFVQTKMKPDQNISKTAAIQEKQTVAQQSESRVEVEEKKSSEKSNRVDSVLPAIISTLLLLPLLLVIFIGVFMCLRKNSMYDMN